MKRRQRPGSSALCLLLMLAGWGVAGWLAWQKYHQEPAPSIQVHSPPVSVAVPGAEIPPTAKEGGAVEAESPFERSFREAKAESSMSGVLVGFCLLNEKGDPLFASTLSTTALCPASALKTATTAAALDLLGPGFRFETTISSTTKVVNGAVEGDLILVGAGDPTLSQEDLDALADAIIASGLKRVSGGLKVDASIFTADPVNEHWNWGDIGNAYGAGAYGVNVDHNRLVITFDPATEVGKPAVLRDDKTSPQYIRWINHVVTGPAGSGDQVMVNSSPYGRTVTLSGSVPLGEPGFEVGGAIPDPPAFALERLKARLEKGGVKFQGRPLPPGSGPQVVIARHSSAPLPEIIDHLHRVSDNLESQCLFLTMARRQNADPVETLRGYWKKAGIAGVGWRLIDGNGLARANMIRPIDLARINYLARRAATGDRFRQSLSAYNSGSVRSKIGAMSGVKTEVGFIQRPDGREYTFALMANGLTPSSDYRSLRAKLLAAAKEN